MRKYEVASLTDTGEIVETSHIAPAMPAFEQAFAALGRGAILATTDGPRAIEDMLPGDRVLTEELGPQTVRWIGSMQIIPGAAGQTAAMGTLTRLTADAFGLGRPMPDLLLGPHARILHRDGRIGMRTGSDAAHVPAREFIDGETTIELRPSAPVRVFHLLLDHHASILANGMPVESYHPGTTRDLGLAHGELALFLSLFPHITRLSEFGPTICPRLDDPNLIAGAA